MKPLVEVEWVDSHVHDRWVSPEKILETQLARCRSVGYLVQDTEEFVTIAQSLGVRPDGEVEEYGQPITIPRVALVGEVRQLGTRVVSIDL